jgi:hypothetical protein
MNYPVSTSYDPVQVRRPTLHPLLPNIIFPIYSPTESNGSHKMSTS